MAALAAGVPTTVMSGPDETRPLTGLRVVVTRAEDQAGGLAAALTAAGATVESLPLLAIVPPADPLPLARAAAELELFDWIVFTSTNAVQALLATHPRGSASPALQSFRAIDKNQPPLQGPAGQPHEPPFSALSPRLPRIAAVGAATASALRAAGIEPRLTAAPDDQSAGGLLRQLLAHLDCGQRVLLPQAADALPTLRDGLLAAGIAAVAVTAYDKRLPSTAPARAIQLFATSPLGWVTFTSPRIVRHFTDLIDLIDRLDVPAPPSSDLPTGSAQRDAPVSHGRDQGAPLDAFGSATAPGETWQQRRGELRALSIGPVTTAELRRQGVEPAAQAQQPSDAHLVSALVQAVQSATGSDA